MSDSDRIENLEAVVRSLSRRVAELEATIESQSSATIDPLREADAASPDLSPPFAPPRRDDSLSDLLRFRGGPSQKVYASRVSTLNLEGLIGRYGTLALATLTILAAVGSFLAWAIARGLFGPWMRIAFGTLFAAALAFIGRRMRLRGERRFGNVLLALALAAIHVVAWGLGPGLQLVPFSVALLVAALASAALCLFAIREADDDLLAVGFGGAYVAPFVTGDGSRPPDVWFAAYGIIVFGAGVLATRGRTSRITFRVVSSGLAIFALTLLYAPDVNGNPSLLSPYFSLAASLAVLLIGARVDWRSFLRTTLALLAATSLAIAFRFSIFSPSASVAQLLGIVLAGLGVWAAAFAFPTEIAADAGGKNARAYALLDYTALPLLLLTAAVSSLPANSDGRGAALCALWGGISAWLAHRSRDSDAFDFFAAGACIELAAAPFALWRHRPELCIPALAAVAGAFGYAATRYRRRVPLAAAGILGGFTFVWAIARLSALPPFTSFPFASLRSFAAASTVAAGFVIVRWNRPFLSEFQAALPWAAAFIWIDVELGRAISPDVSSFLLVAYFAASGSAVLSAGTKRGRPGLRQIGLGLAVIAGVKALFEAGTTQSILAKLGIYLVAGAYLLIVAYMYRKSTPEKQNG